MVNEQRDIQDDEASNVTLVEGKDVATFRKAESHPHWPRNTKDPRRLAAVWTVLQTDQLKNNKSLAKATDENTVFVMVAGIYPLTEVVAGKRIDHEGYGIGVNWGRNNPFNFAMHLLEKDSRQTKQRATLHAVIKALECFCEIVSIVRAIAASKHGVTFENPYSHRRYLWDLAGVPKAVIVQCDNGYLLHAMTNLLPELRANPVDADGAGQLMDDWALLVQIDLLSIRLELKGISVYYRHHRQPGGRQDLAEKRAGTAKNLPIQGPHDEPHLAGRDALYPGRKIS